MARIFVDGFESGGLDVWDSMVNASASTAQKKTGSYSCLVTSGSGNYIQKVLPSGESALYQKLWLRSASGSTYGLLAYMESGVGTHVHFRIENDGTNWTIRAYRNNTHLAWASPFVYAANTWYLFEIYLSIADSGGRVVLKIDGVTYIDFTGDTQNAGTGVVDLVNLGRDPVSASWSPGLYFDDFVLDDADWIGDTRILGLLPTGAGNSAQWDPSAGSNYQCVDEVPASDTDYVSTNVADEVDTYALGDLPISPGSIKCVAVQARAQKEGAATPQNIALVARPPTGGTDYASADIALSTAWKGYQKIWETNPYTTSAWTESEVNGLEAGIKSRA